MASSASSSSACQPDAQTSSEAKSDTIGDRTLHFVNLAGAVSVVKVRAEDVLKLEDVIDQVMTELAMSAPTGVHFVKDNERLDASMDLHAILAQEQENEEVVVITVVVKSPMEWFAGHVFTKRSLRGRRCGMQEESSESTLRLRTDGSFSYVVKDNSHDYDDGTAYTYESTSTTAGDWTCSDEADSITLTGTQHVVWSSASKSYGYRYGDSDDEDGGEQPGWNRERGNEKTVAFAQTFSKETLEQWKRAPLEE